MRRGSLTGAIVLAAAASLGLALPLPEVDAPTGPETRKRTAKRGAIPNQPAGNPGSIAKVNRHTGKPHEHAREIARNERKESK